MKDETVEEKLRALEVAEELFGKPIALPASAIRLLVEQAKAEAADPLGQDANERAVHRGLSIVSEEEAARLHAAGQRARGQ